MKNQDKITKIIYTIIFTMFTMFVFIINIQEQNLSFYKDCSELYKFFIGLWLSVKSFDILYCTMALFVFYAYYQIYFDGKKLTRVSIINMVIAILLSTIVILGKSYGIDNTLGTIFNTPLQIVKCLIISIGYYLVFYALLKKLSTIKIPTNIKKKNSIIEKISNLIYNHPIIFTIIIVLLCWLPYIIIYFPGSSTGDTVDSLCQFFHLNSSWSIDTVNLINEDVYINKHHPVFFTVILGLVFKLGKYLGSFTIGAFIYTILQVTLLLILFSFLIKYMKKVKVPLWIIVCSVLFIGLTPAVAAYAISAIKDTPSAIFTMLYVIFLLQIVRNYNSIFNNKIRLIALIITMLLVILLRNNGIFTILLSFPFLIVLYKDKWKKILITLLVPLLIFGLYDKILLTSLDITSGSIKEVLSIPFMQLARVVHYNKEDFSANEKKIINKVLKFDNIYSNYDPSLADNVKDTYNKDATKEDLKAFYKVWLKYFKKYPVVYVESIFNSTYGYFFPEAGEQYAYLAVDMRIAEDSYFDIKPVKEFKDYREISTYINNTLSKITFFDLFNHVAFYDWFLLFSVFYIIKKKKCKYLIPLLPLLSVLLVCIASPIDGSFRYILPIVFSTPIILMVDYLCYKENNKIKLC